MRKWLLLGIAAVLLIGIAAYLNGPANVNSDAQKPVVEATAPAPAAPPTPEQPGAKEATLTPPSFDIVRVEPTGEMVIGGRGEPGADMTLLTDGKPFDTAK